MDGKPRILVVGEFPTLRTSLKHSLLRIVVGMEGLKEGTPLEMVDGIVVVESGAAVSLEAAVQSLQQYSGQRVQDGYEHPYRRKSVIEGMRNYYRKSGKIKY